MAQIVSYCFGEVSGETKSSIYQISPASFKWILGLTILVLVITRITAIEKKFQLLKFFKWAEKYVAKKFPKIQSLTHKFWTNFQKYISK